MTQPRQATLADHSKELPQIDENGCRTWLTRGANFVVSVSEADGGVALTRGNNADEYWVILPDAPATIVAGNDSIEAEAGSVTIVPPGASSVTLKSNGRVARVFSNRAEDLAARSVNAQTYADGAPECAPIDPLPEPPGGYRLRSYKPEDFEREDTHMRVFRSTNIMINAMQKRQGPRDPAALSPHSHVDFEQASLLLEGDYVHHLRWPWTKDLAEWREDQAVEAGSPSVLIIPATVIHTSRNVGEKRAWLIDIFAPPRLDFAKRPGFVRNAADYPLPQAAE